MPDDKAEEGESGMKMRKNMAGEVIILALCTACLAAGCGSKAGKADETASGQAVKEAGPAYDKAAEYLHDYFGIEAGQDTTPENINGMIRALGGEPVSEELPNDGAVIEAGIKIAGLDELALTYINDEAPDKAAQVLEKAGIKVEDEYAPYVACAVDLDLYSKDSGLDVEEFLYRCVEISGRGRRYLGRVSDDELMERMAAMMNSMVIFDNEELSDLGTQLVMDGTVTGYGLKYAGYDANFLDPYTLKYSHSDFRHAVQLVGLLRSEGMDGYVQIEPKVSVYEYLMEWGTPDPPSPTYAVEKLQNGRYLCSSVEYDLMIEFDTVEEKEKFHGVIERYAKKYDDRVDEDGNAAAKLLAESWWQPLYSSGTPMEDPEFVEMIDNAVYDRTYKYSIHSFSLPEAASDVAEKVVAIAPDRDINPYKIYVNPAFKRYITGEDHQ